MSRRPPKRAPKNPPWSSQEKPQNAQEKPQNAPGTSPYRRCVSYPHHLPIRLSAQERDLIERAAKEAGLSLSRYVAKAITESMSSSVEKLLETGKKFFSSLAPSVTMDDEGKPELTFGFSKHTKLGPALDEVLETPAKIAARFSPQRASSCN